MILIALLGAALIAYVAGVIRCRATVDGDASRLHSSVGYYGAYLAIWTVLPAFLLTIIWSAAEGPVIHSVVRASLPAGAPGVGNEALMSLTLGRIGSIAEVLPSL